LTFIAWIDACLILMQHNLINHKMNKHIYCMKDGKAEQN